MSNKERRWQVPPFIAHFSMSGVSLHPESVEGQIVFSVPNGPMIKHSKLFILTLSFMLSALPAVHAQTTPANPAASAAATPAPAVQAPDDATKKIADMVHAGNYADAQKLTDGLLLAYPNDQRLIKAKALIEKLSTAPAPATPTSQPAQPAASAEQLTGMDKVDYNALILLARQAQATTDLPEQTKQLQQFMDQSSVFLQRHPDQMLLWQLRAATAISLDDIQAGYDAGQKLLAMGSADSNDSSLQRLLAQLDNKGWLDKKHVNDVLAANEAARQKRERELYTFPIVADNNRHLLSRQFVWGHLTILADEAVFVSQDGKTYHFPRKEVTSIKQYWESIWGFQGLSMCFLTDDRGCLGVAFETEEFFKKHGYKGIPTDNKPLQDAFMQQWKFTLVGKDLQPPAAGVPQPSQQ